MPNLNFHYHEAIALYERQTYLGSRPVWIILRQEENSHSARQIDYWNGFIPNARFEFVPGTHQELKRSMAGIADIITTALKDGP